MALVDQERECNPHTAQKKKSLLSDYVTSALDRSKVTDCQAAQDRSKVTYCQAVNFLAATAHSLRHDINDMTLSRNSIHGQDSQIKK